MSAMIVSGNSRYGIVGVYVPPNDTTTSIHITAVLGRFSGQRNIILVGDLNLNLDSIETDQDMEIANVLADSGLLDMHHHFKLRCNFKRQDTWHKKRKENVVRSRPNYFLYSDWQIIRQYAICDPHHFVTNHSLVCGTLSTNTLKENKSYLNGRTRFPHRTPKMGPSLKFDSICNDIEKAALLPVSQSEQRSKSWISDTSWRIVDQKNALCKFPGPTNQTEYRRLTRSF